MLSYSLLMWCEKCFTTSGFPPTRISKIFCINSQNDSILLLCGVELSNLKYNKVKK